MSTKIPGTIHLTRGQWRILAALMMEASFKSTDTSVRRVAEIVIKVAKEAT